jgi:hypothetical protein
MTDLDRDARALLRASRDGDQPSELERARVRRKVMAAIGAAGIAGSASTAHASAHAARGATKLGLGAGAKLAVSLLVAAAAASGVVAWSRSRVPETAPVRAPAEPRVRAPIAAAPAQVTAQTAQPAAPTQEPRDVPRAAEVRAAARGARVQERTRGGLTAGSTNREKSRALPSGADSPPSHAESAAAANVLALQQPAELPAAPAAQAADPLSRELALISKAQRAVRAGQSERALALLQRHAAEFPSGALLQERFATQALAFCALGRVAEGQRAIGELARRSASSPLLGSARRSCATAGAAH